MSGQHRLAPSPELLRHWRIVRWLLAAAIAGLGVGSWLMIGAAADTPDKPPATSAGMAGHWPAGSTAAPATTPPATTPPATTPPAKTAAATSPAAGALTFSTTGPGWLAPGSDPSKLPGPVLIADELNHRLLIVDPSGRTLWQYPGPKDLAKGQTFKTPDDAYFTPDGKQIIATQEDDHVVRIIDIATRKIVYTYGTPGAAGSGPNQLNKPESALMLPSGELVIPDMDNCRIIMIAKGAHAVSRQMGSIGTCVHRPPANLGTPNGLFPMANGNYLMTEATGSWVDEISLSGRVVWSVQLPGTAYVYETNEIGPNRYLTVDHHNPGQVLTFDRTGKVLWRYAPTGNAALNKPSLALALPSGDFVVADSANHRVIVVDARTKTVVWQYGQSKVAGARAGQLNKPTCLDFLPPSSLLIKHAATMGKIPR
jgi:DNA-binding beta-propeller fold protein YncE